MGATIVGLTPFQVHAVFSELDLDTNHIDPERHFYSRRTDVIDVIHDQDNDSPTAHEDKYVATFVDRIRALPGSKLRSKSESGRSSTILSVSGYHHLAMMLYSAGAVGMDLFEPQASWAKIRDIQDLKEKRTEDNYPFPIRFNLKNMAIETKDSRLTYIWKVLNRVPWDPWDPPPSTFDLEDDAAPTLLPVDPDQIFKDGYIGYSEDEQLAAIELAAKTSVNEYDIPGLVVGYRCYSLSLPSKASEDDPDDGETSFLTGQWHASWDSAMMEATCSAGSRNAQITDPPQKIFANEIRETSHRSTLTPTESFLLGMTTDQFYDRVMSLLADLDKEAELVIQGRNSDKEAGTDDSIKLNRHKLCVEHLIAGECSCGVYAFKEPNLNNDYSHVTSRATFGLARVLLWGAVWEHERGYRASNALIDHMWIVDINNGTLMPQMPHAYAKAIGEHYDITTSVVTNEDWKADPNEVVSRELVHSTNIPDGEVPMDKVLPWLK